MTARVPLATADQPREASRLLAVEPGCGGASDAADPAMHGPAMSPKQTASGTWYHAAHPSSRSHDHRATATARAAHRLALLLAALVVLTLLLTGALALAPAALAHSNAAHDRSPGMGGAHPVLLAAAVPAHQGHIQASAGSWTATVSRGSLARAAIDSAILPIRPRTVTPPARADWSCPATIGGVVPTPIDVCKWAAQAFWTLVGVMVTSAVQGLDNLIEPLAQADVFFGTPHALTDQNRAVMDLAWLMRLAALAALGTIVAVAGFNLMLRPHLGLDYHEVREMLSRLCLGGVGITVITWICGQLIDLSNVLCSAAVINSVLPVTLPDLSSFGGSTDPALAILLLAFVVLGYTLFALLVMIQIIIRLATLDLLLVLAPLAMACWILPQTQRWSERWATLFVGILIIQPVQLLTISVGLSVATHVTTDGGSYFGTLELNLLEGVICLATYYVACKVPRVLTQFALGSSTIGAAISTAVIGGSLLRTALTVATLGGAGAAAGAAAPAPAAAGGAGGGGGGGPGGSAGGGAGGGAAG